MGSMIKDGIMTFSTGNKLTQTKALKPMTYDRLKELVLTPVKLPVTVSQYGEMSASERGEIKKEQHYFIASPAKTRSDKAVRAAGLSLIAIDLDTPNYGIEQVAGKLREVNLERFLIYTSLSHTNDLPRFRVVIPLAEVSKVERWQIVTQYLNEVLFIDSDDCSKTMAQAWLLPVVTADGHYEYVIENEGDALDITNDDHPLLIESVSYDQMVTASQSAKPASVRHTKFDDGELSPVDCFNKAVDLRELMVQYGYVFKSQNRAVYPKSESGGAGIFVFPEGDCAYSHHGSDPLYGKSFDAFDLYVQFQHGGNFVNALKAAGDELKTEEGLSVNEHNQKLFKEKRAYSSSAVPRIDIDKLTGKIIVIDSPALEDNTYDISPPPEHCFQFSGIGKDIYDNIMKTAIYPQPTFALATTLMIMSMLSGGRLTGTQTHVRSNLMFICTGESGSGKQHHINKVHSITQDVCRKLSDKVKNKFASGPAFWNFLVHKSAEVLLLADECGFLFNSIKSNKGEYLAQLYDALLQGYSASSTVMKPTVYADQERNSDVDIEHPHICFLGFTTESTLADALTHEDSASGLLPRLIFFPALHDVPDKQRYNPVKLDSQAKEGLQWAHDFTNWKGRLKYKRKYPLHVPTTKDAEELLDTFGVENRNAMRKAESMERSLLNRAEENARRLSLIYWMDTVEPTDGDGNFSYGSMIQVEHVQKAIDLVKWSMSYTMEFMTDKAGATTTSKEIDRLTSIISQAKYYGAQRKGTLFDRHRNALLVGYMPHAVLVSLSKKSTKHLTELLNTVCEMEAIEKFTDSNTGKIYYKSVGVGEQGEQEGTHAA